MYLNTLKGYATPAYSVWVNAFVQKILLGLKLQQGLFLEGFSQYTSTYRNGGEGFPVKRSDSLIEESSKGIISGDFSVKYRMKLISRHIRGDFPAMQSKISYFYVFQADRRNFSVY